MKQEVVEHYDSIADSFTESSNEYCNQKYLEEISRYVKNDYKILEMGCGTGLLLSKVKAKTKVGCDLSGKLLNQLKPKNVRLVKADAENLPFQNNDYNLVYHVNLLEHVPNPGKVVKEGIRVLKKGGKQIIITPNGDIGLLLEIAEKLKLKAPEGPHAFLKTKHLKQLQKGLPVKLIDYRKMVLFPKGPSFVLKFGEILETLPLISNFGFFHLMVLEKIN